MTRQRASDILTDNQIDLGLNGLYVFTCPYLGSVDDRETSLAFRSQSNSCYRLDKPVAIDGDHQESYCLTDRYPACHVYRQAMAAPVMAEVTQLAEAGVEQDETKRARRRSLYALPVVLVLLIIAAVVWWPAPGTTVQEASVLGAPILKELGNASPPQALEADIAPESAGQTEGLSAVASAFANNDQEEESAASAAAQAPVVENKDGSESVDVPEQAPAESVEASLEEDAAGFPEVVTLEDGTKWVEGGVAIAILETGEAIAEDETTVIISDLPLVDSLGVVEDSAGVTGATISPLVAETESEQIGSALFVRDAPAVGENVIETVTEETQVQLLGRDEDGIWLQLALANGVAGWVHAGDLEALQLAWLPVVESGGAGELVAASPVLAASSLPTKRTAVVEVGALNVRSGPGLQADPIGIVFRGEVVALLGRFGGGPWVFVQLPDGNAGWVNATLLAPEV